MEINYYNILLPVPTEGVYTYFSQGNIQVGERVVIPFGNRTLTGIVVEKTTKPDFECKEILMCYNETPLFSEKYINILKQISSYYVCPLGLVLHGVISDKLLNTEIIETEDIKCHEQHNIELTEAQKQIAESIDITKYSCHLIKGITGSGKTEIYQEVAKKVIASGRQVLYIVPEISLTPQLIKRMSFRLGIEPSVFHYKLNDKLRKKHFIDFATGKSLFMLGARSALFIPAKKIGLIIVDEEHESSYKQDESPAYNLRDMAVLYGSILNIPVILGSATPSIESLYNAKTNKYILHELKDRPNSATLPEINIIDIKKNDMCSVGLITSKSKNKIFCRYCDTDYENLKCSCCGSSLFKEYGAGTEKVEEFLENMFPNKVIRIDTESISSLKSLDKNIKRFENKEANILIGTQLIAKGLHFPNVTFVGVLGIDNIMALPDFRAVEKAYQLLVQVAGRAGREYLSGKVYIQTTNPENHVFDLINSIDSEFYEWEIKRRKITGYPPYTKIARLVFSYINQEDCYNTAKIVYNNLKNLCAEENTKIYSLKDAFLAKLQNKFRYEILIKSTSNSQLNTLLIYAQQIFNKYKKGAMKLKIDKDPYFMM